MTSFTGPLDVKSLDSQVTAMRIESSGTATFAGNLNLVGQAIVSGSAVFTDRLRSGQANQRGTAIMVQRATLAAINSATNPALFSLPSGSDIISYYVDVEQPFTAGALVTAARIDLRVGATNVVSEIAVSASGRYDLLAGTTPGGSDTSILRNVTTTVQAFVSTKALASALTAGQAMLTIVYVQN